MVDDTTEFSLHEMENIKRKMSQIENMRSGSMEQTRVSAPATPDVSVDEDTPHLSNNTQNPNMFHRNMEAHEGESLHFRRSLRVLRRHLLVIFFIIIVIPSFIWVADTYFRPKIYVARVILEQQQDPQTRDIMIGMMRFSTSDSDTNDINRIIQEERFDVEMRRLIAMEARNIKNNINKVTNLQERNKQEILYKRLERMAGIEGKVTPEEYYYYRGDISASYTEDEFIEISVRGSYPQVHEIIANNIVHVTNKIAGTERVKKIEDFKNQLAEARDQHIDQLEELHREISRITELVSEKDVKLGSTYSIVNQLQLEQHKLQIELSKMELTLRHLKQEIDWDKIKEKFFIKDEKDIKNVIVTGNPLRVKWRELNSLRDEMSAKYTPQHPKYLSVERDIDAVKEQLKKSGNFTSYGKIPPLPSLQEENILKQIMQVDFEIPLSRLKLEVATEKLEKEKKIEEAGSLSAIVDPEERRRMQKLNDKRVALLEQRESHKSANLELYRRIGEIEMLLNQVKKESKFKQAKAARTSLVSPRIVIDVALGVMLGIVLGCSVAFLIESVDNKLHTPFDVYYHLKLNYLGVVPYWGEKENATISSENPDSHISEIYAHLRNNIRYGRAGSPEKCLLIASATQGEGKSTVSSNIAISYALEGNNVVLIDADLRRPRGHKILEIFHRERPIQYGLSDYLTGDVDFDEIIYSTSVPGLSLIPAGSRVRNPAKLMGSMEMQDLIDKAEDSFDIVIIDCPAVLPVVDATTLSGRVRGVLMVIAAEEVEIGAVKMALYRLQHVGSPIVGAVLNKVRERSTSYYYYGYRYRSGYYYSPYSEPYATGEDEDTKA